MEYQLPDIRILDATLDRLNCWLDPSECHGRLSGYLSLRGAASLPETLQTVVVPSVEEGAREDAVDSEAFVEAARHSPLHALFSAARTQLADIDSLFYPLLPDDDVSLVERTEALAAWCQGYLFGLTAAGLDRYEKLSPDVAELLCDLTEVARLSHEGSLSGDEAEEDESAFAQIVEYVRVGVMLIYVELNRRSPLPASSAAH